MTHFPMYHMTHRYHIAHFPMYHMTHFPMYHMAHCSRQLTPLRDSTTLRLILSGSPSPAQEGPRRIPGLLTTYHLPLTAYYLLGRHPRHRKVLVESLEPLPLSTYLLPLTTYHLPLTTHYRGGVSSSSLLLTTDYLLLTRSASPAQGGPRRIPRAASSPPPSRRESSRVSPSPPMG